MQGNLSRPVRSHVIEAAHERLRLALAVLPEWSRPDYTNRYREVQESRLVDHELRRSTSQTFGLKDLLNEVMADIPWINRDGASSPRYTFGTRIELRPIYVNGGVDPERFVLATVNQEEFPRSFPCEIPVDIVAFGLHGLGSLEVRLRFFCYLVRIYGDAVRLDGNPIGSGRELVRSLGIITCALSDLIATNASNRAEDSSDAAQNSDYSAGQCDPVDDVQAAEERQETSPSVDRPASMQGSDVGNSNPTEGETDTVPGAATIHNTEEAPGIRSAGGFETSERDI